MHILVGFAVLAGLVAFAFGEGAARAFIGVVLGLAGIAVLSIVLIAAKDISDSSRQPHSVVHMGSAR